MINVPYQYNTNEGVSQGRENFWTKRRLCPEINFCLSVLSLVKIQSYPVEVGGILRFGHVRDLTAIQAVIQPLTQA